jgi:hypothetical protein
MALVLFVAVLACVLGLASSLLFAWASGKSPLWNIGFFLLLVLVGASALVIFVTVLSRRLSN